jgi:hypothetical protein
MANLHGHPKRCVFFEISKLQRKIQKYNRHNYEVQECLSLYVNKWEEWRKDWEKINSKDMQVMQRQKIKSNT